MSVAQEEIPNSFNLAKSVLIEGQQFYKDTELELDINDDYLNRANKYVFNEGTKKYEYEPSYALAP